MTDKNHKKRYHFSVLCTEAGEIYLSGIHRLYYFITG